jgi:hypothetical protein
MHGMITCVFLVWTYIEEQPLGLEGVPHDKARFPRRDARQVKHAQKIFGNMGQAVTPTNS